VFWTSPGIPPINFRRRIHASTEPVRLACDSQCSVNALRSLWFFLLVAIYCRSCTDIAGDLKQIPSPFLSEVARRWSNRDR
jgi:hypothetical protein